MKHATFHSMTFSALSARADAVNTDYTVADVLDNGDDRAISVFLTHDGRLRCGNEDYDDQFTLERKEVIGVALCDLDDPNAEIEVLTRDQAVDMLGARFVDDLEEVE